MAADQEKVACDIFSIILFHVKDVPAWKKAEGPILILKLYGKAREKGYEKLLEF